MKKTYILRSISTFMILALLGAFSQLSAKNEIAVGAVALYAPGGGSTTFSSIQAAYNAIDFNTLAGAYTIEVASTYNVANETLPVNLTTKTGASESNTITIRPATSLTITAATKIISFNGAKFVTVDGRAGGSGTTKGFTFENTSTASTASTIDFVNDAYQNTIKFCTVQGSAASTTSAPGSGTIVIGGTNGTIVRAGTAPDFTGSGNLYNTIDNCSITDASGGLPTVAVYLAGTATYTNEGNAITNCDIANFFNPGAFISSGVYNGANSNTTTIDGNKFYQTTSRTYTANGLLYPIYINTTGAITSIADNVIGYSSSTATGRMTIDTGTTPSTTIAPRFAGIFVNAISNGTEPGIMGNTITAIDFTSASLGLATDSPEGVVIGIYQKAGNLTTATVAKPNVISNINFTYTIRHTSKFGLGGYSYNNTSGSAHFGYTYVYGLRAIPVGDIDGRVFGIYSVGAFGGSGKLNKVYNLSCGVTGNTKTHSVVGISLNNGSNTPLTIERNLVYNLNAISTGGSYISGIFCSSAGTGNTGVVTYKNNIIVLGNDVTSGATIRGLLKTTVTKDLFYHNSIYIGGAAAGTAADSYALSRTSATPTSATHTALSEVYQNNIFVNMRSGGVTGKHYALKLANAADYSGGFISFTYNLLKVGSDTRNVLAYIGSDVAGYSAFTTNYPNFATGCVNAEPGFADATASTPDMHIASAGSSANMSGETIATVTDDFAGAVRDDYTPSDLGAYVIAGSTDVKTASQNKLSVYSTANALVFDNLSGNTARIYSLSGQLVKSIALTTDKVSVPSANGFYIVQVNNQNLKVLVK